MRRVGLRRSGGLSRRTPLKQRLQLARTSRIQPKPKRQPTHAVWPVDKPPSGFHEQMMTRVAIGVRNAADEVD